MQINQDIYFIIKKFLKKNYESDLLYRKLDLLSKKYLNIFFPLVEKSNEYDLVLISNICKKMIIMKYNNSIMLTPYLDEEHD